MLNIEQIEELLKIDTANNKDSRMLRIMSCDNPIKDNFIFNLTEIRKEFGEVPKSFENQLALCIYKYDRDLNQFLNGQIANINVKAPTITLTKELIKNAFKELNEFYLLVAKVVCKNDFSSKNLYDIIHFKLNNYIGILQLCGLLDISNNVYRSKTLARILNAKSQAENFKDGRMNSKIFVNEYFQHLAYFEQQFNLIDKYELHEEDFVIYVIMFDIRHYKHNRKNKALKKD